MKKFGLFMLLGIAGVLLFCGMLVIYVISARNSFVSQERKIVALDKKCQASLSTMTNSLHSQGLVQKQYADMLEKALDKLTSARKLGGVAVVVNAIKEDNPNVSDEILKKIQNAIEGHYAKFEADQITKVDAVTIYRTQTDPDTFPRGFLAQTFGFPRIDLDALDRVIMSEEASKAFETGKLGPVDPFSSGTKE